MENKRDLLVLLERIQNGTATDVELQQYSAWCDQFQKEDRPIIGFEKIREDMLHNIHAAIDSKSSKKTVSIRKSLWPYAAAVILMLSVGISFFVYRLNMDNKTAENILETEIKPGGNRATLMLGDGSTIALSEHQSTIVSKDGRITYGDGMTAISPDKENEIARPQTYRISTPRGGQYQVTLSDGTKVWLNSVSELTYPSSFSGDRREVVLKGEGFFEVHRDEVHPFIVKTEKMDITVLGTSFNIMAYTDEAYVNATVASGTVKVSNTHGQQIVQANSQAVLDRSSDKITVSPAQVGQALAWKNGFFQFDGADIYAIMRQLSRWYDLDVTYQGQMPAQDFYILLDKKENANQMLDVLEETGLFRFDLRGNTVRVMHR